MELIDGVEFSASTRELYLLGCDDPRPVPTWFRVIRDLYLPRFRAGATYTYRFRERDPVDNLSPAI